MSVQVENLEKNMAKLTVELPAEMLEDALNKAYLKQKNKISISGFRKGKAPRSLIEKMYGPEVFYEDAANILMRANVQEAVEESGVEAVSTPVVDIVQIEKGKPFIFTAEVALRPEVKLGDYKGITVSKADLTVTKEEIQDQIDKELDKNGRIIEKDGEIAVGDTAVIDFEGFMDGVAFEGGKGEDHPLEIGSHSFIDGFEEQLVGHKAGDELDVNVTFPEEYQEQSLAGKPAVFKVKVNTVRTKELPPLDQEFAEDAGFDSVEEFKADIEKRLTEAKENQAKAKKEDEVIGKLIETSEMELPEPMIDTQLDNMLNEFANRMASQGLSIQQYMQFTGTTTDTMKEQMRPDAIKRIKSRLVLEEVVKQENIQISDDEVKAEIQKMADQYQMEVEKLEGMMGDRYKDDIRKDLGIEKAIEVLLSNAKEA